MTVCWMYVGDLEDPEFNWNGGDWNGNVPRSILPDFPPAGGAYNEVFHRWLETQPTIQVKQTDFGGWVAKVNQAQLIDFLAFAYPEGKPLPWHQERLAAMRRDVEKLPPDKLFGLVAAEI